MVSDQFTLLCGEGTEVIKSLLCDCAMRIKFQVQLSEVCSSYPGIAEQLGLVHNHDWTARLEKVSRFLSTLEAQGLAVLSFHEFEQIIR